jgi:NADH dehydrogenase (ubiquinone) 1 alpha subcomplex subunit 13
MATPNFHTPNQEMPPPGGFKPVKFVKNGPATRGPPGWSLFLGTFLVTSVGYYLVGQHNKNHREVAREERENRIALLPFLQAEADVEYLEQEKHILEKERQVMKNVPGWVAGQSPYHSGRYQAPLWAQKK